MWRGWANLFRKLDILQFRLGIESALALHVRGEVRRDGLTLKKASHRLEIEWWARDVHPWDRTDPPDRRASLFVRQTLADTDATVGRLFDALPQVDTIDLTVRERHSENVILAGTVCRSEPEPALSVGMRLWKRGVQYHSDGFRFEALRSGDDVELPESSGLASQSPLLR